MFDFSQIRKQLAAANKVENLLREKEEKRSSECQNYTIPNKSGADDVALRRLENNFPIIFTHEKNLNLLIQTIARIIKKIRGN